MKGNKKSISGEKKLKNTKENKKISKTPKINSLFPNDILRIKI